jgi:hypothetical protein
MKDMVLMLSGSLLIPADSPGPVIRLNPDELHFNDPDYYDEIFNVTNGKAEKPSRVANAFGPYPAVRVHNLSRLGSR